jgi:tetratricopeptide (TPR) repeat protein
MVAARPAAGVAGSQQLIGATDVEGTGSSIDRLQSEAARLLDSDPAAAADRARAILELEPGRGGALRLLAAALRRLGRHEEAQPAEMEAISASGRIPVLAQVAQALASDRQEQAEDLLLPYLRRHPEDCAALVMLAEIGFRIGAYARSEGFLRNVLSRAPAYVAARLMLARVQLAQALPAAAGATLEPLLKQDPDHSEALMMKASLLDQLGDHEQAAQLQEKLLRLEPRAAGLWVGYGHKLRTTGRSAEAAAAYRQALQVDPACGDAWWALADLKTECFRDDDVAAMERVLAGGARRNDTPQLHFALARACEEKGLIAESFRHLAEGNRLKRATFRYDPGTLSEEVRRAAGLFTPSFFGQRGGRGCLAPDPIFIVGMPRSGSTLVEQILASHSLVEGLSELPHIPALTRRLADEGRPGALPYPELLARLDGARLKALGEEYLERASAHRRSGRPYFIDKMPHNWTDIGFIHLILPRARIIDVRRNPLSCCLSNFRQYFATGHPSAYSLEEMGRYYRDYVRLLGHFDEVLPGRIHRIFLEALVEDSEAVIRSLLDHLRLPFESACLRFHETDRPVRTPSAEQVRRPINREGAELGRAYEPWLGPLKSALGPVLDAYPEVPEPFVSHQ